MWGNLGWGTQVCVKYESSKNVLELQENAPFTATRDWHILLKVYCTFISKWLLM